MFACCLYRGGQYARKDAAVPCVDMQCTTAVSDMRKLTWHSDRKRLEEEKGGIARRWILEWAGGTPLHFAKNHLKKCLRDEQMIEELTRMIHHVCMQSILGNQIRLRGNIEKRERGLLSLC